MEVHNAEIAEWFDQYATLLEMQDANPFRIRAYRNAARTISNLPNSLESMVAAGEDLSELAGIGKDLAGKIKDILQRGYFKELEMIEKKIPATLLELTAIPGLGPKRVKILYNTINIDNLDKLAKAAKEGKIAQLQGFGIKTQAKILKAIEQHQEQKKRFKLYDAEQIAEPLLAYLKKADGVKKTIIAGSYRRRKETVGDIDVLVTCKNGSKIAEYFIHYSEVDYVVSKGTTRSTVVLRSGIQVDLRVVPDISYGAALHYFTGSKSHNITIRKMGIKKGFKVNEYGVFKGKQRIAGSTEEEIYKLFDMPYIEPELRENQGELEAAREGMLPDLVTLKDIRGDLHTHTNATDGRDGLEEMAEAAKARGYQYLAITDHTKHLVVAHGMDAKQFAKKNERIDALNAKLKGIKILKSAEVDILADGTLDLPNSILQEFDLTVCAVHYKFDLSEKEQTERIIRAMDNPYFNILAHPTGRLIGRRQPYQVDMERVMMAALERGCFLEVNGQPERMDLTENHCRMAKKMGLKLVISTDAHSTENLDFIRFGLDQARRGWLEAGDILNTRPWQELKKLLKR